MEGLPEVEEEAKATVEVIQAVFEIMKTHFSPHYEEIFAGAAALEQHKEAAKQSENYTAHMEGMVTFADIVRITSVIWTRSWTVSDGNGALEAVLVPVVDLFNHKEGAGSIEPVIAETEAKEVSVFLDYSRHVCVFC